MVGELYDIKKWVGQSMYFFLTLPRKLESVRIYKSIGSGRLGGSVG